MNYLHTSKGHEIASPEWLASGGDHISTALPDGEVERWWKDGGRMPTPMGLHPSNSSKKKTRPATPPRARAPEST
jgi:hypothetical protein